MTALPILLLATEYRTCSIIQNRCLTRCFNSSTVSRSAAHSRATHLVVEVALIVCVYTAAVNAVSSGAALRLNIVRLRNKLVADNKESQVVDGCKIRQVLNGAKGKSGREMHIDLCELQMRGLYV